MGIGAVLFQFPRDTPPGTEMSKGMRDKMMPVQFMSWRLNYAESRYTNSEREVPAVVKATQEIQWLVENSPFPVLVYTDHKTLIDTMKNLQETHGKVRQWIDLLTALPLQYLHRRNTQPEIRIADGLSRLNPELQDVSNEVRVQELPPLSPDLECHAEVTTAPTRVAPAIPIGAGAPSKPWLEWYGKIWAYLKDGETSLAGQPSAMRRLVRRRSLHYRLFEGILWRHEPGCPD